MTQVVNIETSFEKFSDLYSPKIVGKLNGQHIMLVRCEGEMVPWHTHEAEDELFLIVDGVLDILFRDKTVTLKSGEFYIVPRGVEHRIIPHGHVKLILFEPENIAHTGNVESEITKNKFDELNG